ncbi:MAG: hypothetical protein LKF31_11265 [Muribaculaceae bacterium]|jgi:thiamine biosynthesis lipoprotein ApbE|nr:hypothetical protein [Muribaculaceae bacterium]
MKKSYLLLLIAVVLLSFASCGKGKKVQDFEKLSTEYGAKIDSVHSIPDFTRVVAEYHAKDSLLNVKYQDSRFSDSEIAEINKMEKDMGSKISKKAMLLERTLDQKTESDESGTTLPAGNIPMEEGNDGSEKR